MTSVELEFINFQTPSKDGYKTDPTSKNIASFLETNAPSSLRQITSGMFGYSVSRPAANKEYFYDICNQSEQFKCDIEGWHTESGSRVFEAALSMTGVEEMADRVSLFKYAPFPSAEKSIAR
jgi:glutamine synthetase